MGIEMSNPRKVAGENEKLAALDNISFKQQGGMKQKPYNKALSNTGHKKCPCFITESNG